jgi:hypothetical protein
MALLLPKETASGVVASYHRILRCSIDFAPANANPGVTGPIVTAEIGEYLDEDSRRAGKYPVRTEVKTLVLDSLADKDIRDLLYAELSKPVEYVQVPIPEHLKDDPATITNPYFQSRIPKRPALGYEGAESI